jgi:hypothetical protein
LNIVLTVEDFKRLSRVAREEIIGLLSNEATTPKAIEDSEDGPAQLTPFLVKKFMGNVGDLTKTLLRVFAENDGRATLSMLLSQTPYTDWRKLTGFQAGVTKRVRNILQDNDAMLFGWDESTAKYDDNGALTDGEYFMSKLTLESLKKYYGIA